MILCEIYYAPNRAAGLAVIYTDKTAARTETGMAPQRAVNPCAGAVIRSTASLGFEIGTKSRSI